MAATGRIDCQDLISQLTAAVASVSETLSNVLATSHAASAAVHKLHARIETRTRLALECTLRDVDVASDKETDKLKTHLDDLCGLLERVSNSYQGEAFEEDIEHIKQEIAEKLKSIHVKADDEVTPTSISFYPDPSVIHFLESCETFGQVNPNFSFAELTGLPSSFIYGGSNLERNVSANNLQSLFTRRDVNTDCRYRHGTKSVEQNSWRSSTVSVVCTSESNNSRYDLTSAYTSEKNSQRDLTVVPAGESDYSDFNKFDEEKILNICSQQSLLSIANPLSFCSVESLGSIHAPSKGISGSERVKCQTGQMADTYSNVTLESTFESRSHRNSCVIPDITILPNMSIVLLDHYHNSIQLFGSDLKFLAEEYCEYPMSVCNMNDNSIAVSLRRNGQLAILRVAESTLHMVRKINVPCKYYLWQTAYKSGRLFTVCDENNIHVLDTNGTEYCTIPSGVSTESGFIRNFDVSDDGNYAYLCEKRGLRCISTKGDFKWMFSGNDFPPAEQNTHGYIIEDVCFYDNTLLGTQWISNKVFQISLDGHFVRNIVTSGVDHPRAMAVMNNTLMVTQFYPSMNPRQKREVKVFKISN